MTDFFIGQNRLSQWIESLVSTTLVGKDSSNSRETALKSPAPRIVQVVSIGRPYDIGLPGGNQSTDVTQSLRQQRGKEQASCSTSNLLGQLSRSDSFTSAPQLLRATDKGEMIPTSLLISDGHTTVLAILSCQTRANLARLASNNSLDHFQNNTITRGCVLRINDWRLDTLASAVETYDKTSGEYITTNGQVERQTEQGSGNDDNASYGVSKSLYSDDPLLRNHRNLLHTGYSTIRNVQPGNVVVLCVEGSIDILGGHGLAVVGRPTYIMDMIDVRRAITDFTTREVHSKVINSYIHKERTSSDLIPIDTVPLKRKRGGSDTASYESDLVVGTAVGTPSNNADRNEMDGRSIIITPSLVRRTVTRGEVSQGISGDDSSIPLGDVEKLFQSPKRSKLNEIWGALASVSVHRNHQTSSTPVHKYKGTNVSVDQNALNEMTSAISNDSTDDSSIMDVPIGVIDDSRDPAELQQLFSNIMTVANSNDVSSSTLGIAIDHNVDHDHDRFANQIEEVLSEDYSESGASYDEDDDGSALGIDNMLVMTQEESDDNAANMDRHTTEVASSTNSKSQRAVVRREKHLRIQAVVRKAKNQLTCDSDLIEADIQHLDEDILETQPIHPVEASNDADVNVHGNVVDDVASDDVSVEEDDELNQSLLPVGDSRDRTDGVVEARNDVDSEGDQFHDAVADEKEIDNDDNGGSYSPLETAEEVDERFDSREDDPTLNQDGITFDVDSEDSTLNPIVYTDGPMHVDENAVVAVSNVTTVDDAFSPSDDINDALELTFHRWIRAAMNNSMLDQDLSGNLELDRYQANGESFRTFLHKQ